MKSSVSLIVLIMLSLVYAGCAAATILTYTASSITIVDGLSRAIQAFEVSRVEAAESVERTTQAVRKKLKGDEPDLKGASEAWEVKWTETRPIISQLEEDFVEITRASEKYFDLLEKLEAEIVNPQFREAERQRNEEVRLAWDKTYNQAADDIAALRQLISDGDDLQRMLIAGAIRARLEENIGVVDSLSQRAQGLLEALAQLTVEGQKLVPQS